MFILQCFIVTEVDKITNNISYDEKIINLSISRKYIEDVLKTKGLRKALNFLERLHVTMLRKASLTLQQPDSNNVDVS